MSNKKADRETIGRERERKSLWSQTSCELQKDTGASRPLINVAQTHLADN